MNQKTNPEAQAVAPAAAVQSLNAADVEGVAGGGTYANLEMGTRLPGEPELVIKIIRPSGVDGEGFDVTRAYVDDLSPVSKPAGW